MCLKLIPPLHQNCEGQQGQLSLALAPSPAQPCCPKVTSCSRRSKLPPKYISKTCPKHAAIYPPCPNLPPSSQAGKCRKRRQKPWCPSVCPRNTMFGLVLHLALPSGTHRSGCWACAASILGQITQDWLWGAFVYSYCSKTCSKMLQFG